MFTHLIKSFVHYYLCHFYLVTLERNINGFLKAAIILEKAVFLIILSRNLFSIFIDMLVTRGRVCFQTRSKHREIHLVQDAQELYEGALAFSVKCKITCTLKPQ